jgi:hypothetical protein
MTMNTDDLTELETAVLEALKGCTTQAARVEAIVGLIAAREAERFVWAVYPVAGKHVAVETVTIYGLEIGVDANGYASRVAFVDGAETDE